MKKVVFMLSWCIGFLNKFKSDFNNNTPIFFGRGELVKALSASSETIHPLPFKIFWF